MLGVTALRRLFALAPMLYALFEAHKVNSY